MAGTDRKTAYHLEQFIQTLAQEPYAFGFYQALRWIECLYWEKPRLGSSRRPGEEPIRLAQDAGLAFAPAGLSIFKPGTNGTPHRLLVRLFGLLGTNGPLPLHYTEYVQARQRDRGDRAFAAFLDIFHHRMLSLFYRAWANNEPTVSFDRPDEDTFGTYVGALAGLGMDTLRNRDEINDHTKLYYCGRFASQNRCAGGLQAILTDYFDVPFAIEEFVGEWIRLPRQHICRLGSETADSQLGRSVVVGKKVWSCQHKFRIHIGPLTTREYERFLPVGDWIQRLATLVRNYIGDEAAWDVRLILKKEEVPAARLDGAHRLGWTTWASGRKKERDADDLIIDVISLRKSSISKSPRPPLSKGEHL